VFVEKLTVAVDDPEVDFTSKHLAPQRRATREGGVMRRFSAQFVQASGPTSLREEIVQRINRHRRGSARDACTILQRMTAGSDVVGVDDSATSIVRLDRLVEVHDRCAHVAVIFTTMQAPRGSMVGGRAPDVVDVLRTEGHGDHRSATDGVGHGVVIDGLACSRTAWH